MFKKNYMANIKIDYDKLELVAKEFKITIEYAEKLLKSGYWNEIVDAYYMKIGGLNDRRN